MRTRQHTCRTPYPSAHVEQVVPHRFRKWVVAGKLWAPFIQFSFMRYRTECVFMGNIVPGHDTPGGKRTAAKGIACRYLYKKANTTLMEVRQKAREPRPAGPRPGGKHSAHGGSPRLLTALGGTRSMYAGKMLEFVREDYSHFQCSVL